MLRPDVPELPAPAMPMAKTLMFGGIPAASQWKRNCEAGAGNAKQESDRIELPERGGVEPSEREWNQGQSQAAEASEPSANAVGDQSENGTEK